MGEDRGRYAPGPLLFLLLQQHGMIHEGDTHCYPHAYPHQLHGLIYLYSTAFMADS